MTAVTPGSAGLLALAEKLDGPQCLVSKEDRAIAAAACRLASLTRDGAAGAGKVDPCPICGINNNSPFPCEHTVPPKPAPYVWCACSSCRSHTNCQRVGSCLYPQATAAPVPSPDGARELANKLQGGIDFSDKFNGIAKIPVKLLQECVAALRLPSSAVVAEPVAWQYERGTRTSDDGSGNYCGWREQITKDKPFSDKSVRNLRPLFTAPLVRGDREA